MSGEGIDEESLRLTRSSTIFHALVRIFGAGKLPSCLALHVVGADYREGSTPQQTRSMFSSLFQRLGQEEHVQDLDILFCGPNLAAHLHNSRHSFSYYHGAADKGRNGVVACHHRDETSLGCDGDTQQSLIAPAGVLTVKLRYNCGLYHQIANLSASADALFLFNAGLWGYDDWQPTIEHVLGGGCTPTGTSLSDNDCSETVPPQPIPQRTSAPGDSPSPVVVVTSYCPEEAADDMEAIMRVLFDGHELHESAPGTSSDAAGGSSENCVGDRLGWLWKSEENPHRSLVPRRTECGVEGRVLFENHSWQALRRLRH